MAEDDKNKTLMDEVYEFIKELYLEEEDKKIELKEKYIKNKFAINRFKREQVQYEKVNDTNAGFFNPNATMLNEKMENIKQEIEKLSAEQAEGEEKIRIVEKRMDKISILKSLLAEKEEQEHKEKEKKKKENKKCQEKEKREKEEKECLEQEERESEEQKSLETEKHDTEGQKSLETERRDTEGQKSLKQEECESEDRQHQETLEKENELKSEEENASAILKTNEAERQRIARELHDTTVKNLTGLIHKTEYCLLLAHKESDVVKSELSAMRKMLESTVDEMHNVIYDLRTGDIEKLGLTETVKQYILRLERKYEEITFDVSIESEEKKMDSDVALEIYRIIQEACYNAIKHGNVSLIFISIDYKKDSVEVSIEDDGIGFNYEKVMSRKENNQGLGLSIMKERAELLSGKLDIQSEEEKGTSIKLMVPIAP